MMKNKFIIVTFMRKANYIKDLKKDKLNKEECLYDITLTHLLGLQNKCKSEEFIYLFNDKLKRNIPDFAAIVGQHCT